jgi:hypothetical protein
MVSFPSSAFKLKRGELRHCRNGGLAREGLYPAPFTCDLLRRRLRQECFNGDLGVVKSVDRDAAEPNHLAPIVPRD